MHSRIVLAFVVASVLGVAVAAQVASSGEGVQAPVSKPAADLVWIDLDPAGAPGVKVTYITVAKPSGIIGREAAAVGCANLGPGFIRQAVIFFHRPAFILGHAKVPRLTDEGSGCVVDDRTTAGQETDSAGSADETLSRHRRDSRDKRSATAGRGLQFRYRKTLYASSHFCTGYAQVSAFA